MIIGLTHRILDWMEVAQVQFEKVVVEVLVRQTAAKKDAVSFSLSARLLSVP